MKQMTITTCIAFKAAELSIQPTKKAGRDQNNKAGVEKEQKRTRVGAEQG